MAQAPAALNFASHAAARIAWQAQGPADRPALLLANSLGSDMESWDAALALLAEHFRVIRYDARGHGASTLEASARGVDYTIELLALDALAVADAAGAARFHFAGVSIGGMVGMWLGRHAAHRLGRLVLSNTAAQLPAQIWAERIVTVKASGLASQVDATMQRWFTPAFQAQAEGQPVIARARATLLKVDLDGYLGCAAAVRDMDQRDALPAISVPTLVVTGRFDPSTPPALGQEIATRIPGAACVELPLAHMPQLERPADFVRVVQAFLQG
jgi:3-oxoadipate enol-lactonase